VRRDRGGDADASQETPQATLSQADRPAQVTDLAKGRVAMREHAGTACSPAPSRVGAVDHHHRGCLNAPTAFRPSTKTTGFDLPAVHQVDECPGAVDVIAHEHATRPHMVQRCAVVAILPIGRAYVCIASWKEIGGSDRGEQISELTAAQVLGTMTAIAAGRRAASYALPACGDASRRAASWMRSRRRPRR
jgi:hypothetical protein